jgi:di/tricarboxylate transporter
MLSAGRKLLPARRVDAISLDDPRQYTVEMRVAEGGPLVAKSIEGAGLRHLPGLYLMEIHRGERVIAVVDPSHMLEAEDQLIFVGLVDSIVDLQKMPGLIPTTRQMFKLASPRSERCFAEAVISRSCPMVGQTIREGRFRTRYNAVVVAVSRNGERLRARLGDIALQPGDAVLVESMPAFIEEQRNSNDFYLVSRLDGASPPTTEKAPLALTILIAMVVLASGGVLTMLQAAMLAAGTMLLTRCCSEETIRRSIDWQLLIAIAASFGLGRALEDTGAAGSIAGGLLSYAGSNPWLALVMIYAVTNTMTELITNNAAAVIVFPIAMATAAGLGVNHMPFVMAVMIAASASFATPLGYQTNLMVYGAGGYRFRDFFKVGIPLNIVMWVVVSVLAPRLWAF